MQIPPSFLKGGMMKKIFLLVFGGFLLVLPFLLPALDAGTALPRLSADSWYTPYKAPGRDAVVGIILLDVTSPDANGILAMADSLARETFHGKKVHITVFALNNAVQSGNAAQIHAKSAFSFGLDSSLRMRRALAPQQSLFPYAIAAYRGKVFWNGLPAELPSVLEQVAKGTFSLKRQKEIEGLRKEMSIGIQSALPAVVIAAAEKILKIAPDDLLAIQAEIFSLNAMGKREESRKFLREKAGAYPGKFVLSLLYLEEILLLPSPALEKELASFIALREKVYAGKKEWILLTASLLEKVPFGMLDPEKQLALAQSAEKVIRSNPSLKNTVQEAISYETLARALHFCGKNQEAASFQKKAVLLRKNTPGAPLAQRRLQYYESAIKAGKK